MKLYLSALVLPLLLAAETRTGGVTFRFDDNKPVGTWNQLHSIFMKHGFKYSLAVNNGWLSPKQTEHLRKIAKDGCEIMDHTPTHSAQQYQATTLAEAESMKNLPFVDHVKGKKVYFKYILTRKDGGQKLQISIKDKKVAKVKFMDRRKLQYNALLEFPDGRILGSLPKNKEFLLLDFWGETPEKLEDMNNVTVISRPRSFYAVPAEATRFLAKKSIENHKKLGLPAPESYIIPGGWGIFNSADVMQKIYIGEFKYKNGDCSRGWDCVLYGENEQARAYMAPCWRTLENESLEDAKRRIANAVACHKILIFISHLQANKVPGGLPVLFQRNDELLAWLKAKKIPVHTQAEWSDIIFKGNFDPHEEIFPSLTTDLNEDGIPDGFIIGHDVVLKGNTISGRGSILILNQLTGFVRTTNVLTFEAEGIKGNAIGVDLIIYQGVPNSKNARRIVKKFTLDKNGKKKFSLEIPLDQKSTAIDCKFYTFQNITLGNFSLRAK